MNTKTKLCNRLAAFILAAVMAFTTAVPATVSAAPTDQTDTYRSREYSVNGITAYAYDGADLSQEGITFEPMKDNSRLAKALYYAYGSLGYAEEYASMDAVYASCGAKTDTDKLAISEVVLTKLMDEDESGYDSMAKDFVKAIGKLPDYDPSVFTPYYIFSASREIIGYTSTSARVYDTPKQTLQEENPAEDTKAAPGDSSETTGDTAGASTEPATEASTEKSSEGKKSEQHTDSASADGIRNRNNGTLAKVLGEKVDNFAVMAEIQKHWSDDTYFGQTDYPHYDFVSTLLSNVSGRDIDENILDFAGKNRLEVRQESGTVREIFEQLSQEEYYYMSYGDVVVVDDGTDRFTGIMVGREFYDMALEHPNRFVKYSPIQNYQKLKNTEFTDEINDNAWIFYNGKETILEPMGNGRQVTMTFIPLNREEISLDENGGIKASTLGDGTQILYSDDAVSSSESEDGGSFVANSSTASNAIHACFKKYSDWNIDGFKKWGMKIVPTSDNRHATAYYRLSDSDAHGKGKCDEDGSHVTRTSSSGTYQFCSNTTDSKKNILVASGKAELYSWNSTSLWRGGMIKILTTGTAGNINVPAGRLYTDTYMDNSKKGATRIHTAAFTGSNKDAFNGSKIYMKWCRDATKQTPMKAESSKETLSGYYELYTIDADADEITFGLIWYSDYVLEYSTKENGIAAQRLCTTFSVPTGEYMYPEPHVLTQTVDKYFLNFPGSTINDGIYTFGLYRDGTLVDADSIRIENGMVSGQDVISLTDPDFLYYTTSNSKGYPQFSIKNNSAGYSVREIGATALDGVTPLTNHQIDSSRDIFLDTSSEVEEYKDYLDRYNTRNKAIYDELSKGGTGIITITPIDVIRELNRLISYPNNTIAPAIAISKKAENSCKAITENNANYSLEGAEYTIYTDERYTQPAFYYSAIDICPPGETGMQNRWNYTASPAHFTTRADGSFRETTVVRNGGVPEADVSAYAARFAGRICMDPGTYYIRETKAPKGYMLDPYTHVFTVTANDWSQSFTVTDDIKVDPLSASFQKKLTGEQVQAGDVSVEGIPFKVEYFTDSALADKRFEASFRTDADGSLALDSRHLSADLPSTFPDKCWDTRGSNSRLCFPAGYVKVSEINSDTNPAVGTLLKGTVTLTGGASYDLGEGIVFATTVDLSSGNNNQINWTCVSDNNAAVNEGDIEHIEEERVKRFDICFTKTDEDGNPMAGVPFIIENKTSEEKHLVVSDRNGFVTTRRTDKVSTAKGAEPVELGTLTAEEDPYYNCLDSYISDTDNEALTGNSVLPAPVWFYGTSEDVTGLDTYASYQKERDEDAYHGSLIYSRDATYTIYEIPTAASAGRQLLQKDELCFGCDEDNGMVYLTDGKLDATIINYNQPAIKTMSRDKDTQQTFSKQAENVTIIDDFEITNIKYNEPYTVKGVLVARRDTTIHGVTYHAGEIIKDSDDEYVLAHSSFTTGTTASDGSTVDAGHQKSRKDNLFTSTSDNGDGTVNGQTSLVYTMNTLDFETCGAVWYTYLCYGIDDNDLVIQDGKVDKEASNVVRERTISEENGYYDYVEDEDLENTGEFVEVICIDTDVWTNTYQANVDKTSKQTEVFDDVTINGLVEGETYTLVSKLINPETLEEILDKEGHPCIGLINGKTDTFTFQPSENGTYKTSVTYPAFDSTPFEGKSVVCFQYVYDKDGILIGQSTKLTNDRETLHFPTIHTTATDGAGKKLIPQYGEIVMNDDVDYSSLALNREYVITGTLHYLDKDGKEQTLHYKDGTAVTSTVTFTPVQPEETSGTVSVPFQFDIDDIQENVWDWEETVFFEDLTYDGMSLVTHADIKDKDQTVYFPSLHTSLREEGTGVQHLDTFDKDISLIDTVDYTNLEKGKTYRIIGKLINQETKEVLKNGDREITATTIFTPGKEEDLLPAEENQDDSREDTEDSQTARENTGSSDTGQESPENDFVSGRVKLTFEFNGRDAGLIAEDGHNAPIVACEYVYDNFNLKETDVLRTEDGHTDIYNGITLWSRHADLADAEQTVTVPTGRTTFTDASAKGHAAAVGDTAAITDKITYKGLLPGRTYTATGTLYIPKEQANDAELLLAETDENGRECTPLLDETGKKIQTSVTFIPEQPDGAVDVTFTFNRALITKVKKQIVAFEDVSYEYEGTVFTHKDISDTDQTVYVPELHTTALSADTKDHIAGAYAKAKITDTVQVLNVPANCTCKLTGTLMNQATEKPVTIKGEPVTAESIFTSAGTEAVYNGTVDVVFGFDASLLKGKTTTVYEKLYMKKLDDEGQETEEWVEIANHEDIADEEQTIHFPGLHTKALGKDTQKHQITASTNATIVDTVSYKGLIPGRKYSISGMLMVLPEDTKASDLDTVTVKKGKTLADYTFQYNKAKNVYVDENGYKCNALKIDGEPVTSKKTFTPAEPNGTIELTFKFDASRLAGRTIVVFEDLYANNIKIASHANITDKGQTIKIQQKTPGGDTPSIATGDSFPLIPVILLAALFSAGIIGLLLGRKKFFT